MKFSRHEESLTNMNQTAKADEGEAYDPFVGQKAAVVDWAEGRFVLWGLVVFLVHVPKFHEDVASLDDASSEYVASQSC